MHRSLPAEPAPLALPPAPLASPSRGTTTRRAVLLTAAILSASAGAARGGTAAGSPMTVTVAGTGSAHGTMLRLGAALQRHNPLLAMRLLPNLVGTSGAITAMLEGVVDVAIAGRPPNERERAAGARSHAYARTPFVFVAHPSVPVSAITLDDVVRIYAGTLQDWPDGKPIRLVRRPFNDSDIINLRAISPAMDRAVEASLRRPGLTTAANDQDNAGALEAIPGSFGGFTLAQFQTDLPRLTLLTLDGVEPSPETLAAGRYPLAKTFYAVVPALPRPGAARFLAFLAGPEARAVLAGLGQTPVEWDGAA